MRSRYFFHARLGNHLLPDDVGVELPDTADIKRLIMEVLLESGLTLSDAWTFEIVNDAGELVMRVPLAELPGKQ